VPQPALLDKPAVPPDVGFRGTDKRAGRAARFFMGQDSEHEILFSLPDDAESP